MSELRIESYTMPGADLGPENPLPPFRTVRDDQIMAEMPGLPADMRESILWGHPRTILPYTIQDGYNRKRQPRGFRVAILENDFLRATFLLELGGRLWSLWHKPAGRELLSVNPVFQPANLAIRNAWFSGGVEWNIGTIGHSPFTCAPLFAARVEGPDGPVLRFYEWERIRGVSFQVDAYLPDGSPVLFVSVRITNPHDRAVPMYWWSNISVPETPETRVLVPADSAYTHGSTSGVNVIPVPITDDIDVTYPANLRTSASLFFRIPEGRQPWIAALDGEGRGLVQASTSRLRGRKLFAWGMGPGGRKWQEFLSAAGATYIEIQAGLAPTQMQYLTMPARADWSWLEAYGLLDMSPEREVVRGADWGAAQGAVEAALQRLIPRAGLDATHAGAAVVADRAPVEILQRGSGWGALERRRREAAGEPPLCGPSLVFDDASLGPEQAPWLALLEAGAMSRPGAEQVPRGLMIDPQWRGLLEAALAEGKGESWLSWYQFGVMRQHAGKVDAARSAYERSLALAETPWPLRNLALLSLKEGRTDIAAATYMAALRLAPGLLPLAVECGRTLMAASQPQAWLDLLPNLTAEVRSAGRVRLLEGQAALEVGDLARVEPLFTERVEVDDLREGEVSLSELWFGYHERRLSASTGRPIDEGLRADVRRDFPVPEHLDFRMKTG